MRSLLNRWVVTLAAVFAVTGLAQAVNADSIKSTDSIKEDAILELNMVKEIFANGYAPAQWKNKTFGWDLDTEIQKAQAALEQKKDLTIKDYRAIMKDFFRSTKDYHVGVHFYSTESAKLPFRVAGTQGRYFIVWIDRAKLSEDQFPFNVGDEILEFGGEPVAKVVASLKTENAWSVSETDEALAQLTLTSRRASRGTEVPQGAVEIKVKQDDKIKTYQMIWEYTPEEIFSNQIMSQKQPQSVVDRVFKKNMLWSGFKDQTALAEDEAEQDSNPNIWDIGGKKSWVPTLGTKIWESDSKSILDAYIYKDEAGKVIGYVRMPHYVGGYPAFKEFKEVIKRFESSTDALVIDEVNNPGGSVFYLYALTSVLATEPAFNPKHQTTLVPSMVKEAVDMIKDLENVKTDKDAQKVFASWGSVENTIDGYPINYELAQFALNYTRFVKSEWQAGRKLTVPYFLWAVDRTNPDKDVNYTKPILVLVNELCFSGGDFFPSILQDNKRAKIFGVRTSGAGGYVDEVSFPSRLGLESFSYTGSIAYRIGNEPIENLGVTPDIGYELTPEDFMKGYKGYKAAVGKAVNDLLAAPPAKSTPIQPAKP